MSEVVATGISTLIQFADYCLIESRKNIFSMSAKSRAFEIENPPELLTSLVRLLQKGSDEESMLVEAEKLGGPYAFATIQYYLNTFAKNGFLIKKLFYYEDEVLNIIPTSDTFLFEDFPLAEDDVFTLAPLTQMSPTENGWLISSTEAKASIIIQSKECWSVFYYFNDHTDLPSLRKQSHSIQEELLQSLISCFLESGLICRKGQSSRNEMSQYWESKDYIFHKNSRMGNLDQNVGGTFRFKTEQPLPYIKPNKGGNIVGLPEPKIGDVATFSSVLDSRKSIRVYHKDPITLHQLSNFLYQSARNIKTIDSKYGQIGKRPYPSGGAIYELEIYPLVNNCSGLESGLYHYCPDTHSLELYSEFNEHTKTLLSDAERAASLAEEAQILILIASRFPRLSWKYETIAYSITLKNAGSLLQTMYLTATHLGLAPCAVGAGNSMAFSRAIQNSPFEETTVAEFLLGSQLD